jgi:hypothetical protein
MSAVVAAVRGGDGVEGTAGAADRTQIDAVEQTAAHVGEQAGMLADRATAVLCVTSVMGTQLGAVRERATAVATAAADTTRHSRAAAAAAAEIRALVEGARTGVDTLAAHARDIEATSAALDRLALESRLVALNAAVQAAHAGAAGAGFAVVADKVRELADGASVASAQIIARLSAIRDRAVHAASVMTSVSGRVEGIDAFTAAVAHAAAHQEAGTAEITEAIAEAERSVGEVVRAVEDIAEVGMTLSDDAERGLAAARALREMAEAAGGEDGRDEGTGDEDAADGVAADDRAGTDRVAYDGAGTDRAGDDRAGTIPPEARGPATRGPATRGPSSGTPNARRRAAVRAARRHGVGRAGARPPRGAAGAPAGAVDLGGPVTPGDLYAVALGTRPAVVGHAARARMDASAAYLARCVAERRLVYGVTTGYGPLARHHVGPRARARAAAQPRLPPGHGRGRAAVDAAHPRAHGHAARQPGARPVGGGPGDRRAAPRVPGARRDARRPRARHRRRERRPHAARPHRARAHRRGARDPRRTRARRRRRARAAGLAPVALGHKEGLALVNGTAAMTGIAGR